MTEQKKNRPRGGPPNAALARGRTGPADGRGEGVEDGSQRRHDQRGQPIPESLCRCIVEGKPLRQRQGVNKY